MKTKSSKKKPFEYIRDLTTNKLRNPMIDDEYLKDYEPVVMNKILSSNSKVLPFISRVNIYKFSMMPKSAHFRYLHAVLPKTYLKFEFVRTKKDSAMDDIKIISEYYNCSLKEARTYYELLGKKEIDLIKKLYRTRV